ncbi:MAG: hypothetical protein R3F60_24280 [bacterium]
MKALVLPAVQADPEIRDVPPPEPGLGRPVCAPAMAALNHRDVRSAGQVPGDQVCRSP